MKIYKLLAAFICIPLLASFPVSATPDPDIIIKGENNFYQPAAANETNITSYKAYYQREEANFVYSLENAPQGVTVNASTGEVGAAQSVPVGETFTVKAELASDTSKYAEKTVTVANQMFYDFDNYKSGWDTNYIVDESGGNKWFYRNGTPGDTPAFNYTGVGKATVTYKTKNIQNNQNMIFARGYTTFDYFLDAPDDAVEYNSPGEALGGWYYSLPVTVSGENVTKMGGYTFSPALNNSDWINVKHLIDFDNKTVDTYVNGTQILSNAKFGLDYYSYIGMLKPQFPVDDIGYSTGIVKTLSIEEQDPVCAPPAGKPDVKVQLKTVNAPGPVAWSIVGTKTGVSINSSTGILTVTPACSDYWGTVTVKAVCAGQEATKAINLQQLGQSYGSGNTVGDNADPFDITSMLPASGSGENRPKVGVDNGKYYIYKDGETYNYRQNQGHPITGRVILEAEILNCEDNNIFGALMFNQDAAPIFTYNMPKDETAWHNVKAVVDGNAKTYTVLVDGKPVPSEVNKPLTIAAGNENRRVEIRGQMFNQKVSNLYIYHIGDFAPNAYNLTLGAPQIGQPLSGGYAYYSISGLPESGTVTEYLAAETQDGAYTAVSADYTPTAADTGKFFKYRVTPKSAGGLTGAAVETEPQLLGNIELVSCAAVNVATGTAFPLSSGTVFLNGADYTVNINLNYTAEKSADYMLVLASYTQNGEYKRLRNIDTDGKTAEYNGETLSFEASIPFCINSENPVRELRALIWEKEISRPVFGGITVDARLNETNETPGTSPAVYIVGDSIAMTYNGVGGNSPVQEGWGRYLGDYFNESVTVDNRALGGYSTKAFFEGGQWDGVTNPDYNFVKTVSAGQDIMNLLQPGDYVFVAMGHNDKNLYGKATWVGTEKTTGEGFPVGTSVKDFKANLTRFADETREKSANIIFLTSISEMWDADIFTKTSTLEERAQAVRDTAADLNAICLDLGGASWNAFKALGYTDVMNTYFINLPNDTTHTNIAGAQYLAGLAANLLKYSASPLKAFLK
jgi:lysophospholipase L1-like esterase